MQGRYLIQMFELTIDVLDPGLSRFQLYLAAFIAMVAIFFTILKAILAERNAKDRRKVLSEMREYKEKARQEEAKKRQEEMKKWVEGDDWPVGSDDEEDEDNDNGHPPEGKGTQEKPRTEKEGGPDGKK